MARVTVRIARRARSTHAIHEVDNGRVRRCVAGLLAALTAAAAAAIIGPLAGAATPIWRTESIPAQNPIGALALSFDSLGDGLLAWDGNPTVRTPAAVSAFSSIRSPAGTWSQGPALPFEDYDEQLYLYGSGHAMLIGHTAVTTPKGAVTRVQVVYADGSADGTFGAIKVLDQSGSDPASAADSRGDAIIAWADTQGWRVVEHGAAAGLSAPITLPKPLIYGSLTVALNARGDRVLAWITGRTLYARLRDPHGSWGPTVTVARLPQRSLNVTVRGAISPSGTTVLAWESTDWPPNEPEYSPGTGCDGCPTVVHAGIAEHTPGHTWRAWLIEDTTLSDTAHGGDVVIDLPRIVPLVDSAGRVYVTWTGGRAGAPVVKLAHITPGGIGARTVLSGSLPGAALGGAVAGPADALLVTWSDVSGSNYSGPIYASLRRGGGPFAPPVQLTATGGSGIIGFQPVTGEAFVVTGPYGAAGLQASVNSPG